MPRRKKNCPAKESLDFEESPRHIVHKILSPVFSADCPLTADVVAVDSDTSVAWVSPQFRGPISPGRQKRRRQATRSQHSTTRTRSNITVPATASGSGYATRSHGADKYKPLGFLGQTAATSPIEELSINSQEEVACRRRSTRTSNHRDSSHSPSGGASKRASFGRSPKPQLSCDKENCDTTSNRQTLELNMSRNIPKLSESFSGDMNEYEPRRKVTKTCAKNPRTKRIRKFKVSGDDTLSDTVLKDTAKAETGCTQLRPGAERPAQKKRLFSHDEATEETTGVPLAIPGPENVPDASPGQFTSPGCSRTKPSDFQGREAFPPQFDLYNSEPNNPGDTSTPQIPVSPKTPPSDALRGSFTGIRTASPPPPFVACDIYGALLTPTQRVIPRECKILVYDTPEEDYGLPVRLRREYARNKTRKC